MELKSNQMDEKEETAIQIDNLTVRYRIPDEKIGGVKEYLDKVITRKLKHREFVALKKLNLTIKKGERIGIIGHNGAGKSTLLKVIAHVIKPSDGTISVNGSIAPLLELGAGFDSELTGIENIYLNGSILGRSKKYLDAVRDDIINFADLGEFIDYPVKNYSSGMRAKLGFAIATQVDSDILLVDEVFGVGDENFKRKSKAKMVDMINSGKTVIIVSHDMTQIVDMTDRVIWMNNGEIFQEGDPQEICNKYCEYMLEHQNVVIESREARPLKKDVSKKKQKILFIKNEDKPKSTISKFAKKTGLVNRILNDSAIIDEMIYDRRILRKIHDDDRIIEDIIDSKKALDLIVNNDDILYEVLQNEVVKTKILENPFLLVEQDKKVHKIWGKVDECVYYENQKVLYLKGWYMPVEEYTDIRISVDGVILGEAQRHLHRTGANKGSDNPLNKFSGWEFIQETALLSNEIEVAVFNQEDVIIKNILEVNRVEKDLPESISWKCSNTFTEEKCWELYQRLVMSGFNLLSFRKRNMYYSLFEEYEEVGCLYKKNLMLNEKEIGFNLAINHLGIRGPADVKARNVILGGGCGLGFGVDEDKAWYADKVFEKNWINLCFVCEPKQMKRLIENCLSGMKRNKTAILLYEASFWSMGTSGEMRKNIPVVDMNEIFIKEKESFYDFFNRMYEGIFRIVNEKKESLINCKYAQFDFEKKENQYEYVIREWKAALEQFNKVVVFRVPNKEYICAEKSDSILLQKLKAEQDLGWKILNDNLKSIKNIDFIEIDNFLITDFFKGTGFMNECGNEKLRSWLKRV